MHILFFSDNFPPETNAAASRVFERACYWVAWGHQVTVVTSNPNFPQGKIYPGYANRWYKVEEINGIRVVRVKTFIAKNEGTVLRILDFMSYMCTAFVAGLFQKKPDVIVASSPQFFTAISAWAVARFKNRPFVFELADLWPASIVAVGAMRVNVPLMLMEKLELFLYRQAAAVVALTQSFKNDLIRRNIPEEKIAVIINGVDVSRYRPMPRNEEIARSWGIHDSFVVGYIGTHGMAHSLENVLEAAEILRDDEQVRFLFVGTGAAKDSLIAEAERRELANVIFVPPQPKDSMPDYWSLCDVALVHLKNAAVFETVIPSKIFEAMGMGLPLLLAAPDGEASSIITDERAGLCVPPEDPKALAEAVMNLKNDAMRRREFAKHSLAAVPSHSREKQAFDLITVLGKVALRYSTENGATG